MIQKITANPINMNVWTPENMAGLYFVVFQYWEVGVYYFLVCDPGSCSLGSTT